LVSLPAVMGWALSKLGLSGTACEVNDRGAGLQGNRVNAAGNK